ncbi:hypothetical protein CBOM_07667 [Ceraceosorus bombacis]|uniref:Uncharacterized protein n=1 Tax=Ceraceosorus bombacis TaxID=401625 RepID=A0A0P1BME2_9BASI|nr:hypothetical protein CBOM_07667 [Ceraceosorus bombacis]
MHLLGGWKNSNNKKQLIPQTLAMHHHRPPSRKTNAPPHLSRFPIAHNPRVNLFLPEQTFPTVWADVGAKKTISKTLTDSPLLSLCSSSFPFTSLCRFNASNFDLTPNLQ